MRALNLGGAGSIPVPGKWFLQKNKWNGLVNVCRLFLRRGHILWVTSGNMYIKGYPKLRGWGIQTIHRIEFPVSMWIQKYQILVCWSEKKLRRRNCGLVLRSTVKVTGLDAKSLVGNSTSTPLRLCDKFGAKKGVGNSTSKLKQAGPYSNYLNSSKVIKIHSS